MTVRIAVADIIAKALVEVIGPIRRLDVIELIFDFPLAMSSGDNQLHFLANGGPVLPVKPYRRVVRAAR
jgi:hypothetical protein